MTNSTHGAVCEWISRLLLPALHLKVREFDYVTFFDFFHKSKQRLTEAHLVGNDPVTCASHVDAQLARLCFLIESLADIETYVTLCHQVESNLVYVAWLVNLIRPLALTILVLFLLPLCAVVFLYASSLFLFLGKHWNKLKAAYRGDNEGQAGFRAAAFKSLAIFWEAQGSIWHGHEMVGIENIPATGAALLIYYHAAMPIDFWYVHAKVSLYRNRIMKIVVDRFLFKVPGLSTLIEAFEATPGSLDTCTKLLKNGHILAISPGGVREALFSDHNYEIIWGNRVGFAKVATEAKCAVIPMFTQNCREALRPLPYFKNFFRYVYEKTRLPIVPIYGMFPVKLRTFIGEPIEYDPNRTPEQLKDLTEQRIHDMIVKHQRLPGSIFHALLDRFYKSKTD